MREDFQEQLEKMFPKGYVIVYTQINDTMRCHYFNPLLDEAVVMYRDLIVDKYGIK
jgi:hypothetical protein